MREETLAGRLGGRRARRATLCVVAALCLLGSGQVGAAVAAPPVASFTESTGTPILGQEVTFTDTSTDSDAGDVLTRAWDLDNDGAFDDGTGVTAKRTFTTIGNHIVRLRVLDPGALESVASSTLVARNAVPVATLSVNPTNVLIGENVTAFVTAFDSDGGPLTYAWDLDGDGAYDDSTVPAPPARSYATAGTRVIGVRVTDNDSDPVTSTIQRTQSVIVRAPNSNPVAAFTASTETPFIAQSVTFTDTSTDPDAGDVLTRAWDLDNDGAFDDGTGATASRTFPTIGVKTVRLQVSDGRGGTATTTDTVDVSNRTPTATIQRITPATVLPGGAIDVDGTTSTDPDGGPLTFAWDLDGDNVYDDSTLANPAPFTAPTALGPITIRLRVTDDDAAAASSQATTSVVVTVAPRPNQLPRAAFTFAPQTVRVGEPVGFSSSSTDPDGTLATQAWDLDGDGVVDASGVAAAWTYTTPGSVVVTLKITDNVGATQQVAQTILVEPAPVLPVVAAETPPGAPFVLPASTPTPTPVVTPTPTATRPRPTTTLLRPFPRVRISGRLTRTGARFTRITVTAPRGSRVEARCSGRGCPKRTTSKTVGRSKSVRLTTLQASLRAGVTITVKVTKAGSIGKYTRIQVRRGRAPLRQDLCLRPGSVAPSRCPSN